MSSRFSLTDVLVEIEACDGYVVFVADPATGEMDAHGPYDGAQACQQAAELRADLDAVGLHDVTVRISRLHLPSGSAGRGFTSGVGLGTAA
jgi:hypothetical protein